MSTFSAISKHLNLNADKISKNEEIYKLKDSVTQFNEVDASEGILGRFTGCEVITILKNFRNAISDLSI